MYYQKQMWRRNCTGSRKEKHRTQIKVSHCTNPLWENTVGIKIHIAGPMHPTRFKTIEIDESLFPRKNTPQKLPGKFTNKTRPGRTLSLNRTKGFNEENTPYLGSEIPDSISISLTGKGKVNRALNVIPILPTNKKTEDYYELNKTMWKKGKSRNSVLFDSRTAKTEQKLNSLFEAYQTIDPRCAPKANYSGNLPAEFITLPSKPSMNAYRGKYIKSGSRNSTRNFVTLQAKSGTSQGARPTSVYKKDKHKTISMSFCDKERKKDLFSFAGSTSKLRGGKVVEEEASINERVRSVLRVPDEIKPQFFFNLKARQEDKEWVESDFSTPGFFEKCDENIKY